MASTKFTKRNLNRYRKVYPYVRREPRMALISDKEVVIEVGSVKFGSSWSTPWVRYTFTESFPAAPLVTATSIDSDLAGNADVNAFVRVVTNKYVDIEVSQLFTGAVNFHAIWISS